MSDKPTILTRLQQTKVPIHANYPKLEETWNYICDFIENLQGDGDTNNGQGGINVISKENGHPVIVFNGKAKGGGGGGDFAVDDPWVVSPSDRSISRAVYTVGTRQYVNSSIRQARVGNNYLTIEFTDYSQADPIPTFTAQLTGNDQSSSNKVSILLFNVEGSDGNYTVTYYNRFPVISCWEIF